MLTLPLSNHHNDLTTMCPSPFAYPASQTTPNLSTPRCNADDVMAQARADAFKPLVIEPGEYEVIDPEPLTDEEAAEVETVADETILMRYGDDTGLVERIAADRMLPEVLAEVGETRGGEPEKLGDIATKVFAGITPPLSLEQEQMRAGFDAMIDRDASYGGHE